MLSNEEIKKLADLARIRIEEDEVESLRGEMDAILDYVGQVKEVAGKFNDEIEFGAVRNVMREDENPNESGSYSKELIEEFPEREGDYLKVKKIL